MELFLLLIHLFGILFLMMDAVAVDISPEASELTRENAAKLGVHRRLTTLLGDFTHSQVLNQLVTLGPFCLVVSNPPYLSSAEMDALQPEIELFEDTRALHGGREGLDLIQHILHIAPVLLASQGHLWLEVGQSHPQQISQQMTRGPLVYTETVQDFTGRDRFCHLTLSADTDTDT